MRDVFYDVVRPSFCSEALSLLHQEKGIILHIIGHFLQKNYRFKNRI